MTAAIFAAENGADVLLLEKNEKLGRKLGITGKGRCNVTNNCDLQSLEENIPNNARFLYGAFSRWSPVRACFRVGRASGRQKHCLRVKLPVARVNSFARSVLYYQ